MAKVEMTERELLGLPPMTLYEALNKQNTKVVKNLLALAGRLPLSEGVFCHYLLPLSMVISKL
jgi:hypothetical protein